MASITPENFGAIYCVDVLWKITLLRMELLMQDEDNRMAAARKRAKDLSRKEASEISF